MEQFSVQVQTDGRLLLVDDGHTYHVNIAGPGNCSCGSHRPGAACRHVSAVRSRYLHRRALPASM